MPLPPDAADRRRSREGEPYRSGDYAAKRWREEDHPMLGWRYREPYATKSTFITLALDDGADADVIESRVTHTKRSRSAFDGYNRGVQWARTCSEVSKLNLRRRAANEGDVMAVSVAVGDSSVGRSEERVRDAGQVVSDSSSSSVARLGTTISHSVSRQPSSRRPERRIRCTRPLASTKHST